MIRRRSMSIRSVSGPAALACAAALTLAACSSNTVATVSPPPVATSAQEAADVGAREQSTADRDGLEKVGAEYAAALADAGLPLPPTSNHATLAQVARGICGQIAAGTSDVEIREELRPFTLYAISQAGGALDEEQAGQAYLDAARLQVC